MDIIRRYVPNINAFDDKHKTCDQLIRQYMANYPSIVKESESQFICKYYMSAILAFCAEIRYKNLKLLDTFIRFFVANQSGIWDIWSIHDFQCQQWNAIENCLAFELKDIKKSRGFDAIKYIVEITHQMNIDFIDPNDQCLRIRFIDFPRFDSIESKSTLWRNLHKPVIDCTLLPANPIVLRLLLQYGACIPDLDHQIPHLVHRICISMSTANKEILLRKLFWIKFVLIDVLHRNQSYKELSKIANEIIYRLKVQFNYCPKETLIDTIPVIPSLKQLTRNCIRKCLQSGNRLPNGIQVLEIDEISKQYLNLQYL